ncbi:S-adenosylmethionine uptake transporter [Sphingomonas kaistensis]|uniref:S-adenosylmethionine uptake transporter n=1 Tax=Sphingomonas kaistensis TaxID=298708 RepID=A0A7X6BG69_9SPHN|nr:DMT family transporter [Sphingomonas kaistensis]NJC04746.1 S-adenosylmethionine uptake transporter [Sphingomonas kaistensis]
MIPPRPTPALAFAVGTLGIALFSGMDAIMKGLVLAIGVYATMLWRSFVGVGLSGLGYGLSWKGWPERKVLRLHVERGVLTSVMGLLFFWGIGHVPLAQAIALAFIAPLIALFLAAVLLGEVVGKRTVGASLLAFAGVVVIFIGQARADLGREALLGSLAILASAVLYAINIIMMRRQSQAAGPLEIAFFQNVTVSLVLLLALPVIGTTLPPLQHWPALLAAAALSTLSLLLLSWAYARAEASYLAATEYTAFLWAALFGWLVFGEHLSGFTLAGAGLIVTGCLLAARSPQAANPHLEAAA